MFQMSKKKCIFAGSKNGIEMDNMLRTMTIRFSNEIEACEIPCFRGAIIKSVGDPSAVLFHNHVGTGYLYRYPQIQYKRIGGKAAIVCVGQGTEEIGAFFNTGNFRMRIGDDREETFEIEAVQPRRTMVQVWDDEFRYYLRGWLPLNPENHKKYQSADSIVERMQILEQVLIGNILSACKGLGITIEREIICKMISVDTPHKVYYKGQPVMSFSCEFKSNITLPDYIGLGKGASMGHGMIKMINDKR